MNDFETTLLKFVTEADELQKSELALRTQTELFTQKWVGFMKASGLPDNFTLPQVAVLAIRKARELVRV